MRIIRAILMTVGVLTTLAVAGVVAALIFYSPRTPQVPERTFLTLDLERRIPDGVGGATVWTAFGKRRLSLWETVAAIERAAADDRVVGLRAKVGASHMGLAQVQELRDAVRLFRQSGKPTYVFAESFGEFGPANAAFYLAAAFEKIYLQPTGAVGLTGLVLEFPFFKGSLEKLDLQVRGIQRGEYKGIGETFTESGFTPPQREAFARIMESLSQQLTAGIAEGRGLSPAAVRGLMQQGPLSAQEALEAKLVDGLHYRDEVNALIRREWGASFRFLPLSTYRRRLEAREGDAATVALIYGTGQVHRGRSRYRAFSGERSMGSDSIARAFRRAAADDEVQAIIFRIDSPGGSYVASDVIRRAVQQARRRGKPVIASMGNVAGSGGYFIAAPAYRIVAQPATLTGSIGVAAGKVVTRGLWDKLGVSWDQVAANGNATFWSPLQDYDPAQRQRLEQFADVVYDDFVTKVSVDRRLSRAEVDAVARGRVWTGADARENGLVDRLGGYAATLAAVREAAGLLPDAPLRLRLYPSRRSPLQLLAQEFTDRTNAAAGTPASDLWREAAARLGVPASWAGSTHRGLLEMALPMPLR